jgi:hypothetical protein
LPSQVVAQGAIVPSLCRLGIANGFQVAIRRRRIDAAFRDSGLAKLATLPIAIDAESELAQWRALWHSASRCWDWSPPEGYARLISI